MCQPAGWMMLKRISSVTVNAAWPAGERDRRPERCRRAAPRWAAGPRAASVSDPMAASTPAPIANPIDRADDASHDELAGVQGVRTQHGQRAEDHPERVLHAASGSATRTASPSATAPRTLLCSQTECRSKCAAARSRAAASAPPTPSGWRPSSALPPAPPLGERGQLDVVRDLRDREAQLLRAKARIERREELADLRRRAASAVRAAGSCAVAVCSIVSSDRSQLAERPRAARPACARRLEQVCSAFEHRRGGRLHAARRRGRARPCPECDLLCAMAFSQFSSSTSRTIVRAGCSGRSAGTASRGSLGAARPTAASASAIACSSAAPVVASRPPSTYATSARSRAASALLAATPALAADLSVGAGHSTAIATTDDHRCHAPAHQPVRDRRGGTRARHREDEGEQQRGRGAREHRADDPGKQHAEGDERHRRCREPCVARGQRRRRRRSTAPTSASAVWASQRARASAR